MQLSRVAKSSMGFDLECFRFFCLSIVSLDLGQYDCVAQDLVWVSVVDGYCRDIENDEIGTEAVSPAAAEDA